MFENMKGFDKVPKMNDEEFEGFVEELLEYISDIEENYGEDEDDDEAELSEKVINQLKKEISILEDEFEYDPESDNVKTAIAAIKELLTGGSDE